MQQAACRIPFRVSRSIPLDCSGCESLKPAARNRTVRKSRLFSVIPGPLLSGPKPTRLLQTESNKPFFRRPDPFKAARCYFMDVACKALRASCSCVQHQAHPVVFPKSAVLQMQRRVYSTMAGHGEHSVLSWFPHITCVRSSWWPVVR